MSAHFHHWQAETVSQFTAVLCVAAAVHDELPARVRALG
jgi:hypothetical protein